jgi:FMN phosphatase YigB (HAD superfamily)
MPLQSKRILTDVDDTVLKCTEPLEAFLTERLGREPTYPAISNVRIAYDIDEDTAYTLIHDFWRSEAMLDMEPEACAAKVLPRLYSQGWRFVAITACAPEPEIIKARKANLLSAFGFEWEDVHCTGYHSVKPDGKNRKSDFLSEYPPSIWVEDSYPNALAGALLGNTTFLIHRSHNETMEHNLVHRVNDWHEIENYIKEKNL